MTRSVGVRRRVLAWSAAGIAAAAVLAAPAAAEKPIPSAREIIERAFENFYDCDLKQRILWEVRQSGTLALEYQTQMLRKFIGGRANDLFYIVDGDRRKWKVLRIENRSRDYEAFVYTPEFSRPRRYSLSQRGDKFMGLELNLEDMEIQRLEKYEIVGRSFTSIDGEPAYVVALHPLYSSAYDRVDYFVARSDFAILQARYYRRGAVEPYKFATAKRDWMVQYPDHVLPRRMDFVDRDLGTETTIRFVDREVDPELPQSRFSTLSLEKRRRLSDFRGETPEVDEVAPVDVGEVSP